MFEDASFLWEAQTCFMCWTDQTTPSSSAPSVGSALRLNPPNSCVVERWYNRLLVRMCFYQNLPSCSSCKNAHTRLFNLTPALGFFFLPFCWYYIKLISLEIVLFVQHMEWIVPIMDDDWSEWFSSHTTLFRRFYKTR